MSHVERVTTTDSEAKLLLTQPQYSRGHQLNKGTLTARIRSPLEGVTAVKLTHWDGVNDPGPNFELNETKPTVSINNKPKESLSYTSGPLALNVDASQNNLAFTYTDTSNKPRKLTGHSFRSLAYISDSNTPSYNAADQLYAERDTYLLLALDLSVHEKIYGLGERFGPFVKNGQSVDIWNEDGGTSSELTYKNIPFYISSRGYGVFVNHPGRVMLEVQSERTTRVNIVVRGENVEYMVVAGPSPKAILDRYTALTGRPGLPPAWSYGLWLTTSFTTSYDEKTVTGFLDGFKQRNILLSAFHLEVSSEKTSSVGLEIP